MKTLCLMLLLACPAFAQLDLSPLPPDPAAQAHVASIDSRHTTAFVTISVLGLAALGWAATLRRPAAIALAVSFTLLSFCAAFPPVEIVIAARPPFHDGYVKALGHLFIVNIEGSQRIIIAQWSIMLAVCAGLVGLSAWWAKSASH